MKFIAITILLALLPSLAFSATEEKPYFSLNQTELQKLVDKANTVKVGSSYESVISIMGTPTHDSVLMAKQNNEVIGRVLMYYAVNWEKGLVNELHDQLVSIYFEKTDHVKSVNIKVTVNGK